jgi:hypothetical protein
MAHQEELDDYLVGSLGYTQVNLHKGRAWLNAEFDKDLELEGGEVVVMGVRLLFIEITGN